MADRVFLGTGMKVPPQVNPATGRFACVSGKESVQESVYLIIMTQKTERYMRPEFGSNAAGYVFSRMDATMRSLIAHELERDILSAEPRVGQVQIRLDGESSPGCLFVSIDYVVRGENVRENMVFPFYLGEGNTGGE